MPNWIENNAPKLLNKKILYLCMEMMIPELNEDCRQANFKGGLGLLAGDTMEGFKNLGLDVTAVIPIYNSRWKQAFQDNTQRIIIKHVDYIGEPIEPLSGNDGEQVVLNVDFEGVCYPIKVFKMMRAGVPVYLLYNDEVFDILYNSDRKS
ncbi:MAG: glycogen/starch synthase, partial [Elusimicrobiota bacterium]